MARKLTFRQLVVLILALSNDLSQKQIEGRARMPPKRLSQLLKRERQKEIDDDVYELLLSAVAQRRAGISLVRACLETLDALDRESGLAEDTARPWPPFLFRARFDEDVRFDGERA